MMRSTSQILVAISALLVAQAVAQQVGFSVDEATIYRDFLLHYPMPLGDLIGMQPTTGDFSRMKDPRDPSLAALDLLIPTQSNRKLPADVMLLTGEAVVTRRLANAGQVVSSSKRNAATRPDGFVKTHLQLSEIAFDRSHQRAVFVFSASCGCKGGDGGVAVYRHTGQGWHLEKVIDTWEG